MSYTVLTPGRKTGDRSWEKFQPGWRAQIVTRRTYNRPLDMRNPVEFETWEETVDREISHQRWLWDRAQAKRLTSAQENELEELRYFYLARAASSAGRIKWLGGTKIAQEVEPCIYNCSALATETVHDLVDQFWLLLNGVGIGFESVVGTLFGFATYIPDIEVVGSQRDSSWRGRETNHEIWDPVSGVWQIRVGDSAKAWAKAAGKLMVGYHRGCKKLIIDTTEVRGPGERLNGYGWICAGDSQLRFALHKIADIRNAAIGRALTQGELHDVLNLLGTVLSTRRSAQIGLRRIGDVDWEEFGRFKDGYEEKGYWWRSQSNNTLQSQPGRRPTNAEIDSVLDMMFKGRKGEPGIRNLQEAKRKASWSDLCNACSEILLPRSGGVCNLVETVISHPLCWDFSTLCRVIYLNARANYRQTCTNMLDGVLQAKWHENNQHLRLCGVGLTGIVQRPDLTDDQIKTMRLAARAGADEMADELGLPRSQAVTTVKPSGTLSKALSLRDNEIAEGINQPKARHLINWINADIDDPVIGIARASGIRTKPNPYDPNRGVLMGIPVRYLGDAVNPDEPAVDQLDRYIRWANLWADHSVSITIDYKDGEEEAIKDKVKDIWDRGFISASFLPRTQSNYLYLPQESVARGEYDAYVATLKPMDIERAGRMYSEDELEPGCKGGACPVR